MHTRSRHSARATKRCFLSALSDKRIAFPCVVRTLQADACNSATRNIFLKSSSATRAKSPKPTIISKATYTGADDMPFNLPQTIPAIPGECPAALNSLASRQSAIRRTNSRFLATQQRTLSLPSQHPPGLPRSTLSIATAVSCARPAPARRFRHLLPSPALLSLACCSAPQ
jgi:hypothetical protein